MLPEDEKKLIELLAIIYNTVNWAKMRTRHGVYDIFNHRVRAASRRNTLYEAVSKLANYFGLQSLPQEAIALVQELRPLERQVLNKLYLEHIPMSMLAIMRAKQIREERKLASLASQKNLFSQMSQNPEEGLKNEEVR